MTTQGGPEPGSLTGERRKAGVEQRTGDPPEQKVQVHLIYLVVGQLPVARRPLRGRCRRIPGASQDPSSSLCWRRAVLLSVPLCSVVAWRWLPRCALRRVGSDALQQAPRDLAGAGAVHGRSEASAVEARVMPGEAAPLPTPAAAPDSQRAS